MHRKEVHWFHSNAKYSKIWEENGLLRVVSCWISNVQYITVCVVIDYCSHFPSALLYTSHSVRDLLHFRWSFYMEVKRATGRDVRLRKKVSHLILYLHCTLFCWRPCFLNVILENSGSENILALFDSLFLTLSTFGQFFFCLFVFLQIYEISPKIFYFCFPLVLSPHQNINLAQKLFHDFTGRLQWNLLSTLAPVTFPLPSHSGQI